MTKHMHKLSVAATLIALTGLLLATPVLAEDAAPATQKATESVSPSQISRDRINAIRANKFFYQSFGNEDP